MPVSLPRCFACETAEFGPWLYAVDRNQRVDDRRYEVRRCPSCGLGWTVHRLSAEEMGRYYPETYYGLDENRQIESNKVSRAYRDARIERIQRHVSGGLLLDIGAGTGMFLKSAKEAGFEVEGLELSRAASEFGTREWGVPIRQGDLHESAFPSDRYDVITLGHVFEHLREPLEAAGKLYNIAKPGGLLVIAVPNFRSPQARFFGNQWFHLDVPRHQFHYTPQSLSMIIERAGFATIGINYFSSEHNWAGILGSVMRLHPSRESILHKSVRKLLGVPIARAAAFAESAAGLGGTFELYAKKPAR